MGLLASAQNAVESCVGGMTATGKGHMMVTVHTEIAIRALEGAL